VTLTTQHHNPRSASFLAAIFIAAALALAGFLSLGVWQVKRLAWKEALMARIDQHVHAAPAVAPGPTTWSGLQREADEYRRLSVRGRFSHEHETLVHASTELGSGYWVLTPLRAEQGFWVLINRGFVPPEWRERSTRQAQEPVGDQEVIGLLRLSEPGGSALQQNDAAHGRWYSRDVVAMVTAQGLSGSPVAPYFIDAAASAGNVSDVAWPRPGLTLLRFSNNHLVYALTWFALAAMTAGAIGYLVVDERRLRRLSGERRHHDELARR
jgi:surfeit locus 1 family protein